MGSVQSRDGREVDLRAVFWRLWRGTERRGWLAGGLCCLLVNSATNLYFPHAIGKIVDSAASNGLSAAELRGPGFFFITGAVASFFRVYSFGVVKENSANQLKNSLVDCCLEKDLTFFDDVGTGELLTAIDKDVPIAADIFAEKIPSALRSFNSAILGSIFLFRVSPFLCMVSLSTIPLVGVIAVGLGKTSSNISSFLRELEKEQSIFVSERFRNMSTVILCGTQSAERERFSRYGQQILSKSQRKYLLNGLKMGFVNIATNASIIAVLYTGSRMVQKGEISQGDLTAFLMRSGFVGLGFSSMSNIYPDIRSALISASNIFCCIDSRSRREDPVFIDENVAQSPEVSPTNSKSSEGSEDPMAMSSYVDLSLPAPSQSDHKKTPETPALSFRRVSFAYPTRPNRKCLNNINIDFPKESFTAIAGASGAGKSSILALMSALYFPQSGNICVGDKVLSCCSDEEICTIRQKIAVVQQSSVLFSGSISYNIGYGVSNATSEDIEEVARETFAHEFIAELPDGYDTDVGEGGSRLSGGQKQRILLCRALLRGSDILILDEPSSSLDCENEDILISILSRLKKTKCVVVFTHSPTLMAAADMLHLLEEGAIVESGRYEDLKSTDKFRFMLKAVRSSA